MKKLIIFIAAIFCLPLSMPADDSYYYYCGNKMPLGRDLDRIVVIAPAAEDVSLPESDGFTLVNTITDTRSRIRVYRLTSSQAAGRAVEAVSSQSANIMPCYRSGNGGELIPNGYLNVKLKSAADYPALQAVALQEGCEIIGRNPFMPLWYNLRVMDLPGHNPVAIANAIYETGKFACSFPSFSLDAALISYDPKVSEQWGLYNSEYEGIDISMSKAWSYATGRGIKVAVIDEGIDLTHKDLEENIDSLSYDAVTGTSPSKLYGDHGTHCAGIIAAVRNNGIQVVGVAPDARLISVSDSLNNETNMEAHLANGINWAWENGADIISCSWRCKDNEIIRDAIVNAVTIGREGKGCVIVAAAGNIPDEPNVPGEPDIPDLQNVPVIDSGKYSVTFPANYGPEVIAVSNMTKDGTLSNGSCYGPSILVTAPGTRIYSTIPKDTVGYKTGTSMACPHVAGLAALILERNPSLTYLEVREIIARNTKKVGDMPYIASENKEYGTWNEKYGYGLIDAYKAVLNTPRRKE